MEKKNTEKNMQKHSMKSEVVKRCLVGTLIGLAISYLITIFISLIIGDGSYYSAEPELIAECGSEMNAVVYQMIASLLYGAAFGGASVVWETDWSILKQTLVHLAICSAATFPTAWLMHWMDHSAAGVAFYFGIFFIIYFCIWLGLYFGARKNVASLNRKING